MCELALLASKGYVGRRVRVARPGGGFIHATVVGYIGQGEDEEDHEMWHVIHVRSAIANLHAAPSHQKMPHSCTRCLIATYQHSARFGFSMCADDDSFVAKLSRLDPGWL
jgi:hypothetical protein